MLFAVLYIIAGLLLIRVPFTALVGAKASFTLFDFFAPIAVVFLGPVAGVVSILAVLLGNAAIHGGSLVATPLIIRICTLTAAALYLAYIHKNSKKMNALILLVPLASIIIFNAHPIGRTVWYYSLFWTIPFIAYLRKDLLFMRALGATFAGHAIGGAIWIWAYNTPAGVWNALIPIVIKERLVFAIAVTLSYMLFNAVIDYLLKQRKLTVLQVLRPAL